MQLCRILTDLIVLLCVHNKWAINRIQMFMLWSTAYHLSSAKSADNWSIGPAVTLSHRVYSRSHGSIDVKKRSNKNKNVKKRKKRGKNKRNVNVIKTLPLFIVVKLYAWCPRNGLQGNSEYAIQFSFAETVVVLG